MAKANTTPETTAPEVQALTIESVAVRILDNTAYGKLAGMPAGIVSALSGIRQEANAYEKPRNASALSPEERAEAAEEAREENKARIISAIEKKAEVLETEVSNLLPILSDICEQREQIEAKRNEWKSKNAEGLNAQLKAAL